ncbi:hypothetical protein TKK_0001727 [Trichogramma kaykai]
MNRTIKFLAPAYLATISSCLKVYTLATHHRQLNIIAKAGSLSANPSSTTCAKYSNIDEFAWKIGVPDLNAMTDKVDIATDLQKMRISDNCHENVNKVDADQHHSQLSEIEFKDLSDKERYTEMRKWRKIDGDKTKVDTEKEFVFKILSFNILAQDLLETHRYLYKYHDPRTLPWTVRKPLLIQEILDSEAHIVCLQEMQEEHLQEFLIPFKENGFTHLYKKRTNDKKDGLLLMYKQDLFNLLDYSKVELYQKNIELLSRDNVGLIAKFSLKESPDTKFVIATTHLLYNPRRNDVRLGQVQLLFAEIERIAFVQNLPSGPQYLPMLLSGDFNLEPFTGVYKFITEGSIEFAGKNRNLEECNEMCQSNWSLTNSLIPPYLYVTDECQHFKVVSQRLSGKGSGRVMLKNTENPRNAYSNDTPLGVQEQSLVNLNSTTYQKIEIANGHYATFSSGLLTHPFQLKSVYNHKNQSKNNGLNEATTFQDRWITVDYIFYSDLVPLEKYTLPTVNQCLKYLPTIPNRIVGSDHLSLGATFKLLKR